MRAHPLALSTASEHDERSDEYLAHLWQQLYPDEALPIGTNDRSDHRE